MKGKLIPSCVSSNYQKITNYYQYKSHHHLSGTMRRKWHPTPVLSLENPMDGRASQAAVRGVAKSRTQLSDFTFTFYFHALEKEMATHSSVLAWSIPGTGEPGGLPSTGSHRVGHDLSDLAVAAACSKKHVTYVTKSSLICI